MGKTGGIYWCPTSQGWELPASISRQHYTDSVNNQYTYSISNQYTGLHQYTDSSARRRVIKL